MNFIDVLLIVIILLSAFSGWRRGFIFSFTELVSWIGSIMIGFLIYPNITSFLSKIISDTNFWTIPLAFLISIILARGLLSLILNSLLKQFPEDIHHRFSNKLLGVIPGFINGILFAALLAIILSGIPLGNSFSEQAQESSIAYKFTSQTKWIENKVRPVFSEIMNNPGSMITIHPETNKLIKLPFKASKTSIRPDLEKQMLELINRERSERNLGPLKADPELREVARSHSRDMFSRGYFSHYSIEGKDPFDRIKKAEIIFLTAGENLALSPNLKTAHNGLMESPGHKANILHPGFGRVGIGILDGGSYGIMVTQNFRN
ncbi:CvpA family protein [Daejeonella oryzae]|uniref:CvpA family protein n=1 Tax=Daejeonella oryzae TaxID=1122943 RepID=UPI0003F7C0AA|nr:CvpA family protein [Daejeonella oryzae]